MTYHEWRKEQLESGRRVQPVCALFYGGPTRWGAFEDKKGEVASFVRFPLSPELDREVQHGP